MPRERTRQGRTKLDDGAGPRFALQAAALFNPGYSLSINDGSLYTNIPTITLSVEWGSATHPINQMWVGNDGGFGVGSWQVVTDTLAAWQMDVMPDTNDKLPRTVYVKFRATDGRQYRPVQDGSVWAGRSGSHHLLAAGAAP